ncbi:MAG: glutathione S-transferase N-terminal domain-containing protein [Solimonas sp.]
MHVLAVTRSVLVSTFAAWRGAMALRPAYRQPVEPLRLYDIEACPYCRLVRDALTELDLDVLIQPCPKGGQRFRPQAIAAAGKAQFPLLVDPNTGRTLYESADIVEYLAETYDGRAGGTRGLARAAHLAGSMLASAAQFGRGLRVRASRAPAQPLELYSFEASPYSRLVRERLCELELPYLLRSTGKARLSDIGPPSWRDRLFKGPKGTSRNRRRLLARTRHVQVPYLIDPNAGQGAGREIYESAAILAYLDATYAA